MDFYQAGFLEGRAKGMIARAELELARSKNAREEQYLGIAKEELGLKKIDRNIAMADLGIRQEDLKMRKETHNNEMTEFGWKKTDRERYDEQYEGMAEASKTGGYSGMIDYLKTVNPAKAIEMHMEKLKLDNEIMNNDVLKATSKNDKNKAMFESYGQMAKIAYGINKLPADQQAKGYEMMLPMIRKVWPNAPDKLNKEAMVMGQLAIAQGTPENMLYASNANHVKFDSKIADLHGDLAKAKAAGYSNDSPIMQDIRGQIKALNQKNDLALIDKTRAELTLSKNAAQALTYVRKDLYTYSKDAIKSFEEMKPIVNLLDRLEENPGDGYALNQLRNYVGRQTQKGVMTEQDYQRTSSAAGYESWSKNLSAFVKGEQVALNPAEVGQIKAIERIMIENEFNAQVSREQKYGKMLEDDMLNKGVDYSKIPKPSQDYQWLVDKSLRKQDKVIDEMGLGDLNPAAKKQFIARFRQADTPEEKNSLIMYAQTLLAKQNGVQAAGSMATPQQKQQMMMEQQQQQSGGKQQQQPQEGNGL